MSVFVCLCLCVEGEREEQENRRFHLLVLFQNACSIWSWARLKRSEARSWVFHLRRLCGAQGPRPSGRHLLQPRLRTHGKGCRKCWGLHSGCLTCRWPKRQFRDCTKCLSQSCHNRLGPPHSASTIWAFFPKSYLYNMEFLESCNTSAMGSTVMGVDQILIMGCRQLCRARPGVKAVTHLPQAQ